MEVQGVHSEILGYSHSLVNIQTVAWSWRCICLYTTGHAVGVFTPASSQACEQCIVLQHYLAMTWAGGVLLIHYSLMGPPLLTERSTGVFLL